MKRLLSLLLVVMLFMFNGIAYASGGFTDDGYPIFYNRLKPRVSEEFFGNLKVSKSVTNVDADTNAFTINVLLTDSDGVFLSGTYGVSIGDGAFVDHEVVGGVLSIELHDGESFVVKRLPKDVVYKVTEDTLAGYSPNYLDCFGVISSVAEKSVFDSDGFDLNSVMQEAFVENTYSSYGEVNLVATKQMIGADISDYDGDFTFVLYDNLGRQIGSAQNDGEGRVILPTLSYTESDVDSEGLGSKTYHLSERLGDIDDVIYDEHDYVITVNLVDNKDGTITATPVYPNDSDVVFSNKIVSNYVFEKENEDGDFVPGCSLQVLKSDGTFVDEWITSAETGYRYNNENYSSYFLANQAKIANDDPLGEIFEVVVPVVHSVYLDIGSYILREVDAPDGYGLASDIPFEVRSDGIYVDGEPVAGEQGDRSDSEYYGDMLSLTMVDPYAYDLIVEKHVTGGFGNKNDVFDFEVAFVGDGVPESVDFIKYSRGSDVGRNGLARLVNGKFMFTLSDSEHIVFKNIPSGVEYTVSEDSDSSHGYLVTKENDSGVIDNESVVCTFTNSREFIVPTGIDLGNSWWVFVACGLFMVFGILLGKKSQRDN